MAAELVAVVCVVMESRWLSRFGLTRPIHGHSPSLADAQRCYRTAYSLSVCTGGFFEPGNFGSDPQARCLDGEMDIARVGESYCASAHGHENRVPALTRDSRSCEERRVHKHMLKTDVRVPSPAQESQQISFTGRSDHASPHGKLIRAAVREHHFCLVRSACRHSSGRALQRPPRPRFASAR